VVDKVAFVVLPEEVEWSLAGVRDCTHVQAHLYFFSVLSFVSKVQTFTKMVFEGFLVWVCVVVVHHHHNTSMTLLLGDLEWRLVADFLVCISAILEQKLDNRCVSLLRGEEKRSPWLLVLWWYTEYTVSNVDVCSLPQQDFNNCCVPTFSSLDQSSTCIL